MSHLEIIAFAFLCVDPWRGDAQNAPASAEQTGKNAFVTIYGQENGNRRKGFLVRGGKIWMFNPKKLRQDPAKDIRLQPDDILIFPEATW